MEYVLGENRPQQQAVRTILCCQCGVDIEPNPANMCVACLRTQIDITEGIPKTGTLYFCRNCERYLQPPSSWITAVLESRELLSMCLKRIKGLNKVHLVDAGFIWTEPHSKRIKVKISIQKEVMNGAVLQQVFVVEFTVHNQMCEECHRVEAKDFWRAMVQVRQKAVHKKTFFYLEQLILKHKAHANTVNIKTSPDGLDFYFVHKQEARKLLDFLSAVVPCRYNSSQELISHDIHNNTYDYKYTFCVEIVPICKDDIVCLPPKLAQSLSNFGQVCICQRVTQTLHLIDPNSLKIAEVSAPVFWRASFSSLCNPKQLVEFIVMDIEIISDQERKRLVGQGAESKKHILANVWVVKASELGTSDRQYHCRTHLGHLLAPGDAVLGFDLTNANVNDTYLEKMKTENIPDVVLLRKVFGDRKKRNRRRNWKLKHLQNTADMDTESAERDYTEFLEDLEEDPTLRQNVNIYINRDKIAVDTDDTDDEETPRISLQEMLDDLHISEDATGGEGAAMMD